MLCDAMQGSAALSCAVLSINCPAPSTRTPVTTVRVAVAFAITAAIVWPLLPTQFGVQKIMGTAEDTD